MVLAAGLTVSATFAAEWPGGASFEIPAGVSVTNAAPRGSVACFTNNGALTFLPGGSVTLTGAVTTAVGSGTGSSGALDLLGGSITNLGTGRFVVGHLGGSGAMAIGGGAVFRTHAGYFCIAQNEEGRRELPSSGEVTVAGTLTATNRLEFTGFFPTNGTPPYAVSARLTLAGGGVVEAGEITKNDCAASEFVFRGGTLRAGRSNANFITGRGVMDLIIADGAAAVFDTAGRDVAVRPQAAPHDAVLTLRGETGGTAVGNGGLVKAGPGALAFRLPAACNTFTGAVTVLAGTLDLGRPLAENQTVTVHAGAHFVPHGDGDLAKITYLGGAGERMTYVVAEDRDGLDLTALNALYRDDRLAGPFGGDPAFTLSNAVVHSAGASGNPFRLLGQVGTLNLTNTGLETAYLQLEGPGTFNFLGSRTYAFADAGKLTITDGGYRQANNFTVADPSEPSPASLALPGGRFGVGGMLGVGLQGFGRLAAEGAAVSAGSIKVGGADGYWGAFAQSAGTVTANGESYVGTDGGSGTLLVTGGQFVVNANLRVASNPGYETVGRTPRPLGSVTVSNALLRCSDFYFTSWWVTDGSAKTVEAGVLRLLPGGVAEVNSVQKNDDPVSTLLFDGGTLRARNNHALFLNAGQAFGTLNLLAGEGQFIALDTQAYGVAVTSHPGTVAFSGPGGLKKLGAGTLFYAPDRSDYAGDTVIEAGALWLGDGNKIPDGPGAGHVRIAAGAALDLNGKDETVNRLIGLGRVVSTNAPATLGVLADGSDDTWERAWLGGPVTLAKRGGGTLTLTAAHSAPAELTVHEGAVRLARSVGYPYYRFKVEGVKNPATANSMQFAEVALYDGEVDVTPDRVGVAYDPTGGVGGNTEVNAFPANETPEKAVDGIVHVGTTTNNKWLDFRAKASRTAADKERVWLRIDFPSARRITHYNWATGNDAPERDPAAWRLQGSYDGEAWTDLDVKTGYAATGTRNAWVEAGGFPVSSENAADVVNDAKLVTVRQGASLALDGVPETVGGLAGGGAVTLADAELTLAVPAGLETVFYGAVTGNGGVIKEGAGTQVMYGTNAYAGATVVREGVLRVQGLQPHRWFRFTVKRNKANVNVTQYAELALYGVGGQRWNIGLTQGAGVDALGPGQFATPAAYQTGSPSETPDKLFDNAPSTKWCPNNNTPNPDTPATWRTVVMRLAEDAPEITAYNLCTANDAPERDPVTWTLEGSADGVGWTLIDARSDLLPPSTGGSGTGSYVNTGRFLYYNEGVPYGLAARAVSAGDAGGDADVIPAGSAVEVRGGATLDVQMAEGIGALRVDMLDAGTLTRLIAEPGGALYVVNAGGQTGGLVLPLVVGEVVNRQNLATWAVYIDGVLQNGVTLGVGADGRLRLVAKGTVFTLQ
jgi:autotransporter-associated beta strand protein